MKFKNCFNDVKEQAFVHMIYSTYEQIIKRSFLKTEGVRIKSYDINSHLEGHCTVNTVFFFFCFFFSVINLDPALFAYTCIENCS